MPKAIAEGGFVALETRDIRHRERTANDELDIRHGEFGAGLEMREQRSGNNRRWPCTEEVRLHHGKRQTIIAHGLHERSRRLSVIADHHSHMVL